MDAVISFSPKGETMKLLRIVLLVSLAVCAWGQQPKWAVRLHYIEACSCDLFCPCYFNTHASHQGTGAHYCTFNNVARVETGKYGDLDLSGMKVWLSGDLGSDWATKGQANWLVATFEPSATQQQKDAMMAIFTKIYPVKWKAVTFDTSEISWSIAKDKKTAAASLKNGKGDVKLTLAKGFDANKPAQVQNTRYFAADWNGPFDLYHSDHFYKGGPGKDYALKQANGFTIVVEASSDGKRVQVSKAATTKTGL
jgi:hypothetical protein